MDLRDFETAFASTSSGNAKSLVADFLEKLGDFTRVFQNMLLFIMAQDLSDANQNPVKSGFLLQMASFIDGFNEMIERFTFDTSVSKPVEEVGDYVCSYFFGGGVTGVYTLEFMGAYYNSAWQQNYFKSGNDSTWRDSLGITPVNNYAYIVFSMDHDGTTEYTILKVLADAASTATTPFTGTAVARIAAAYWYSLITQSRDVDVQVDLLETQFPELKILTDNVQEILDACALAST